MIRIPVEIAWHIRIYVVHTTPTHTCRQIRLRHIRIYDAEIYVQNLGVVRVLVAQQLGKRLVLVVRRLQRSPVPKVVGVRLDLVGLGQLLARLEAVVELRGARLRTGVPRS